MGGWVVYLAHSQHERSKGDVAPGTIQREMRQIIAWYAPTPTFARAGSRCGGGRENMRSCRYCKAFVVFFVIKSITYIHLSAEYKLPILSLQQLNTIDLILSRKYKIKFYNDLFSAWSEVVKNSLAQRQTNTLILRINFSLAYQPNDVAYQLVK